VGTRGCSRGCNTRVNPEPLALDHARLVVMIAVIVVLDSTVLNVSIPTILRGSAHLAPPTLQWSPGSPLTFATLLIIGRALGTSTAAPHVHHRLRALRLVSLCASEATSVTSLLIGEAIIEGIALRYDAGHLAICRTRSTATSGPIAFAVWGATAGAAVAFGPVVGLPSSRRTTPGAGRFHQRDSVALAHRWRWAFHARTAGLLRDARIDGAGALRSPSGIFPARLRAERAVSMAAAPARHAQHGSWDFCWRSLPFFSSSRSSQSSAVAAAWRLHRGSNAPRTRRGRSACSSSSSLLLGFRYGFAHHALLAMGQLGFLFVLPVLLPERPATSPRSKSDLALFHLACASPWAPSSVDSDAFINTYVLVVRSGPPPLPFSRCEAVGLGAIDLAVSPHLTCPSRLPGW